MLVLILLKLSCEKKKTYSMNKEKYIQQEISKATDSFTLLLLPIAASVILLLIILDYFVTPENFKPFLIYRVIAASLYAALFLTFKRVKKFSSLFIILAALVVSTMIELMVFALGGHQSSYYAGFIVVFVFLFGLLPISFKMSMLLASIIYGTYLLPILALDKITNPRIFINNNIFLIATLTGGLIWRYINYKVHLKRLSLEYDLSKEKEQLQIYSRNLKDMVAERTKELTTEKQRYMALFDNANDGIAVFDKNGIILNVNKRFCELHGFEKDALIGTHIRLLEAEDQEGKKKERMNRILNGEPLVFETEHYRRDGSKILLEVSSKAIDIGGELYIQSFHRDITEKKRLQEQLFQSQKMESIGILAGGIAHDFNNILTAILGNAELLHNYSNLDATSLQKVKTIEGASRKAGQMVTKLLSFARKGSFEMQPLSLNDVINDTTELIEKMMANKKIDIKIEIDNSIPAINGDSNQLEQVIMNLILNASDAMPDGGAITIKTSFANLGDEATRIHSLLSPGRYVVLTISDTGKGIPDEIKSRIFDPFFTTKGPGKGTGLGLAMVYGIVKEHRGVINVESQVGRGTTFDIYIPASDRVVHRVEKVAIYPIAGRENILVVDDEPDVLNFIKETLGRQGYKVLITDNPVYALDIFKQISENIDLVITDIVMPLVNGRELIRHFKIIKPRVKIIAISGYDASMTGRRDKEIDAFIRKPFEGIYLLSTVRRVLDTGILKGVDLD